MRRRAHAPPTALAGTVDNNTLLRNMGRLQNMGDGTALTRDAPPTTEGGKSTEGGKRMNASHGEVREGCGPRAGNGEREWRPWRGALLFGVSAALIAGLTACQQRPTPPRLVTLAFPQAPVLDVGAVEVNLPGCNQAAPHSRGFTADLNVTYTPATATAPVAASFGVRTAPTFTLGAAPRNITPGRNTRPGTFAPGVTGPHFGSFSVNVTPANIGVVGRTSLSLMGLGTCQNVDTDGDGIRDRVEDANGNGRVDAGETDPNNPDSDADGLFDGVEDANFNGRYDRPGETDPRNRDSDGDGRPDGEEDTNRNGRVDSGEKDPRVVD